MKFEYTYRNTPGDYWKFYHGNTYSSMTGIVNVTFTVAMLSLLLTKWNSTNGLGKGLMILALMVFPVFQPLVVYFKSIRDAVAIQADTHLIFDDYGLRITVNNHQQQIPWKDFYSVLKRKTMIVAVPDGMHAYLIPNRVLGEEKTALYSFATEMIGKYSTKQEEIYGKKNDEKKKSGKK